MNCPTCGAENSEDARFCAECGSPLDDQDIEATIAGQIIDVTDDDVTILSTPDRLISESETVTVTQMDAAEEPVKGDVPPLPRVEAVDVVDSEEVEEEVEVPRFADDKPEVAKTTPVPQEDLAQAARQALSPEAGDEKSSQPFAGLGIGQNKRLLIIAGAAGGILLLCCCSTAAGSLLFFLLNG